MDGGAEVRCCVVRGRVQGVGFRFFVMREATRLGLRGTVRNMSDGAVEVVTSGSAEQLDRLELLLHGGPEFGHVSTVDKAAYDGDADDLPEQFMIVP